MKHDARRVVTGHDENGVSVIVSDTVHRAVDDYGVAMANRIWSTESFPTDNQDPREGSTVVTTLAAAEGSTFYYVDWAPGGEFPPHRTLSVDYLIVLEGEIELGLENGETTRLTAGDAVVQRGALHSWRNPTDQWTRTAIVMVGSKPIVVDGTPVEPTL